jgi:phosphoribosylamine--glycine ligase/phosphoribosylglycinamide formyltransferase/phosphoribosylformylglycinamidine cyclo-ligase/phosphoribosylamine--glycine ligase/phosphoribosylformylglycinamidine cyclo-ligase
MATATALGFGGRAPALVLDLLSRAVREEGIVTVTPTRSQALPLALMEAPFRTFLSNDNNNNKTESGGGKSPLDLLVYCLPTSVTEYLNAAQEATLVRSKLLYGSSDRQIVVVIYDVHKNAFVGGETAQILDAVGGNNSYRQKLAMASLASLAELDQKAAAQLGPDRQQDSVIVVGAGGREHALAVALAQSPLVGRVLCCPGNGGTAVEGGKIANVPNGQQDNESVVALVKETNAAMVVVGPEAPLVDGLVDALAKECPGTMAFGPTQAAAELEASKAFSKDFLQEHGIPTAKYRNFTDVSEAIAYVESLDESDRQVVKASGLAAGKGVLLPTNKADTIAAVKEIMSDKAFGNAGDICVIESFLVGPEASCLAFCDGKTARLMPAAQDHKRALDDDQGLNTGGMGAYAPAPCVTPVLQRTIEEMCIKTVQKMAERGTPYVGVLYAGMMLTPNGPYVLEFNCRFGDPETQVVLPLLETDLYEILTACCSGNLDAIDVRFKEGQSAATVVCAALGYPEVYPKGMEITGLDAANSSNGVKVYHAGTDVDNAGVTRCSGGRVLAITGTGSSLKNALQSAYNGVKSIQFIDVHGKHQLHRRTDIGKKATQKNLRIGVLGSTRGTALIPVVEACRSGELDAEIVALISNKSSAPILEKGRALGVTVLSKFISAKDLSREQYDSECTAALVAAGVDFVLLVGYMRILSKSFTDFWKNRCINVHPSLLPKHAGGMDLAVHQAVINAKETESGCTIHQVTEAVDGGPIVIQKRVLVDSGDTAESLKVKVQLQEGPAFVEAIKQFSQGATISYADAGVSIDAGNKFVDLIKPLCKATRRAGCDADLGGFGGLFDLAAAGYDSANTVIIGATDGVGTKLRIAQATGKHETIGVDLVAMCVNDLIVAGGEPLFFLDYFATGHLDVHEAAAVVKGIAEGCQQAQCGLIGGETAEMPSMYAPGDYDVAGFAVGAVPRDKILPCSISSGDVLLGLASSGIHSNGFSLVRKLIEKEGLNYSSLCPWEESGVTIGDSLLTPTKIYVRSCLPMIKNGLLKGLAHITGGGLLENLPRSLPSGVSAEITAHPKLPPVFKWMKKASGLSDTEMLRTFNCGIGMVLILSQDNVGEARDLLTASGETDFFELGGLVEGVGEVVMKTTLT